MLTDLLAHRYTEDPKLLEEVEDEDFDPDDVERQLAQAQGGDPPVDDWEEVK